MSKVEVKLLIDGCWLVAKQASDEDILQLIVEVRKALVMLEKEQAHRDYLRLERINEQ